MTCLADHSDKPKMSLFFNHYAASLKPTEAARMSSTQTLEPPGMSAGGKRWGFIISRKG